MPYLELSFRHLIVAGPVPIMRKQSNLDFLTIDRVDFYLGYRAFKIVN